MKNNISHISRRERRKIERRMARMSPSDLNRLAAEMVGISERELYESSWRKVTIAYSEILKALIALMRQIQPMKTELDIFSRLAANQMPLPIPYSIGYVQQFVVDYLSPKFAESWSQLFTDFIREGYFIAFDINKTPLEGGAVRAIFKNIRGDDFFDDLDIGLIPTPDIDKLIPLAKGEMTIDDLWNEYLKSDPFGRFGI